MEAINIDVHPPIDASVYYGSDVLEGQMDSNTSDTHDILGQQIKTRLRDSERYLKVQNSHGNLRTNMVNYHQPPMSRMQTHTKTSEVDLFRKPFYNQSFGSSVQKPNMASNEIPLTNITSEETSIAGDIK